ncbi:nucleoside-diphosphate kinase [Candidatus Erwinia haradaeae]|uniref:Nucleoside diphosphate kinase n=1 Tax=Candidatus Erwinia haradaeae TaxID=1922217 RepID=A0A451DAI5_9GAMM|nr:nucleoside-diphosphate kinase [Candidatus Erwinia haradaeae]VFP83262.1 Nucleoside diphosphate kinase [Candidatus Erwinia haradaeae]
MMIERTFSIIKPHAVAKNIIGAILNVLEHAGFKIIAVKMLHISLEQAAEFYSEHKEKPFFEEVIQCITSGPAIIFILEKNNAIQHFRDLIGATNPKNAIAGTIRAKYATNITENAIHGSDSAVSARREMTYFFQDHEIFPQFW